MRTRQADEWAQRRRMDASWRPKSTAGRPSRRLNRPSDSTNAEQRYLSSDYLPNHGELGVGAVDKLEELHEIYNFINWSKHWIGLDKELQSSKHPFRQTEFTPRT